MHMLQRELEASFRNPQLTKFYATSAGVPVKHGIYSIFKKLNKSFTGPPKEELTTPLCILIYSIILRSRYQLAE
jgi:hypothetical protein